MPIEIQIYLAKFLPVPRRGEPRNVGLVVRTASDELLSKFLLEGEETQVVPKKLDLVEYAKTVGAWKETMKKHGVKSLHWVGKRNNAYQKYYLEFVGGEMVQDFNFDKLFEELVL